MASGPEAFSSPLTPLRVTCRAGTNPTSRPVTNEIPAILERTGHPPAMPKNSEVAVLPDEVRLQVIDGHELLALVLSSEPVLGIGKIRRCDDG